VRQVPATWVSAVEQAFLPVHDKGQLPVHDKGQLPVHDKGQTEMSDPPNLINHNGRSLNRERKVYDVVQK